MAIFQNGIAALAAAFFAGGAAAQTSIPIPKSGSWTFDARQSHRHVSTLQAGNPMTISVNTCGDQVVLIHPSLIPSRMVLSFQENGKYEGGGRFLDPQNRTAPISWSLKARSRTRMEGQANMNLPSGVMSLKPLVLRLDDAAANAPELGSGELRVGDLSYEHDGRMFEEVREYTVILSKFLPGSAQLLPEHMRAIGEARHVMTTPPDGYQTAPGRTYCRTSSSVGPVRGFADQPGVERQNWLRYARNRANNTAAQFDISDSPDLLDINTDPDQPGPVGMGTCRRAAVAHIEVRHQWFYRYSAGETERWLRDWFNAAAAQYEGEQLAHQRARARLTYCFAEGIRQRAEAGQCPSGVAELQALEGNLQNETEGRRWQVQRSYEALIRDASRGENTIAVTAEDQTIAENQGSSDRSDCSDEVVARAREIETEVFGDVAPDLGAETGQITGPVRWINENVTEPLTDFWDPNAE